MATRCTRPQQGGRDSRRSARRAHNLTTSSTSEETSEPHDERTSERMSRPSHEHVTFAAAGSEDTRPACSSRCSQGGSLQSALHAPRLERETSMGDAPEIRSSSESRSYSRPRHLVRDSTRVLIQQLGAVLPINQARFGERVPFSFHKNTFQKQKEGCSRNSWRNSLRANEIIPRLLQTPLHIFLVLGLLVNAAVIVAFAGFFCTRPAPPPPGERRAVSPARPLCLRRIGRVGGAPTRRCGTSRVPVLSR